MNKLLNNNKGFTLIEILAVIIILGIILVISIPSVTKLIVSSKKQAYKKNEDILAIAGKNYYASKRSLLPKYIGSEKAILLNEMIEAGEMENIYDPNNNQLLCDGFVIVKRISEYQYKYTPYLKCGDNYITDNYRTPDEVNQNILPSPTYVVTPTGWATQKTIEIDYKSNFYTKQYSIDGGKTWVTSPNSTQSVAFSKNGTLIAKIIDNNEILALSSYSVTGIDTTAPINASVDIGLVTSKSITVIANGTDMESNIKDYRFSKDGGTTWTSWQGESIYTFNNLTKGTYEIRVQVRNNVNMTKTSLIVNQATL